MKQFSIMDEIRQVWAEACDFGIMGLDEDGKPPRDMNRIEALEDVLLDVEFAAQVGGLATKTGLSVGRFSKSELLLAMCFTRCTGEVCQQLSRLREEITGLKDEIREYRLTNG